jgi:hypothetical protein
MPPRNRQINDKCCAGRDSAACWLGPSAGAVAHLRAVASHASALKTPLLSQLSLRTSAKRLTAAGTEGSSRWAGQKSRVVEGFGRGQRVA